MPVGASLESFIFRQNPPDRAAPSPQELLCLHLIDLRQCQSMVYDITDCIGGQQLLNPVALQVRQVYLRVFSRFPCAGASHLKFQGPRSI